MTAYYYRIDLFLLLLLDLPTLASSLIVPLFHSKPNSVMDASSKVGVEPYSHEGYLTTDVTDDSDFSIDNIPFGIGCIRFEDALGSQSKTTPRCFTAIGKNAVDLSILQDAGAFLDIEGLNENVFSNSSLNAFMEHPAQIWSKVRRRLQDLFSGQNDLLQSDETLRKASLHDLSKVEMILPVDIGDYTDFYSSREHATNCGTMLRGKDNALNPNWLHLPVGYHGRASTVFCSGQPITRPRGQLQNDPKDKIMGSRYGPCELLDFELEVAFFVGGPKDDNSEGGKPLTIQEARDKIFGFVLMNDWSARDIQKWEYVPLGPFTSKNFATTISPWIVTSEALSAYKVPTSAKTQDNPPPLQYLRDPEYSSYDIKLSVAIQSSRMMEGHVVCRSNSANLYWDAAQQLVHHSVSGCRMRAGDLLGSGTISGSSENTFGSMLELSWGGSRTVLLSNNGDGERRKFLEDGDTVIMKGSCSKDGHGRIGFGECRGQILAFDSVAKKTSQPTTAKSHSNVTIQFFNAGTLSSRIVQIALNAKGAPYTIDVNGRSIRENTESGKHPALLVVNTSAPKRTRAMQRVDTILEFLDQCYPASKRLFPQDPFKLALVRDLIGILSINLEASAHHQSKDSIKHTLSAVEDIIRCNRREATVFPGPYASGGFSPGASECFLIPQLQVARKIGIDVGRDYPILAALNRLCNEHPWFENVNDLD